MSSLQEKLNSVTKELMEETPEAVLELILGKLEEYADSQVLDFALKTGYTWPDFCLPGGDGKLISSVDLRLKGPLVVTFFPWRMVQEQTRKIVDVAQLNFHVLSDTRAEFAQALNIAWDFDEALRPYHREIVETYQEDWAIPLLATYVVGQDGRIVYSFWNLIHQYEPRILRTFCPTCHPWTWNVISRRSRRNWTLKWPIGDLLAGLWTRNNMMS